MKRNSMLCPNCGKLISSDEAICPYCKVVRPGSFVRNNVVTRGLSDSERLVKTVIWLNVGMYILSLLFSAGGGIGLSMNPLTALSPSSDTLLLLGATGTIPVDKFLRWWSMISASYLHGSILHIFFNMMAFRQLAPLVIREYGAYRMVSIYTLGGVLGFFVSYLAGVRFTIGASAAVCALLGATLYFGKSRGGVYGQAIYRQVMGWVITLFVFGLLVPGINNWGHGGGIVGGILIGYLVGYNDKKRVGGFDKLIAAVCAVVTVLVLCWAVGYGVYYRMAV